VAAKRAPTGEKGVWRWENERKGRGKWVENGRKSGGGSVIEAVFPGGGAQFCRQFRQSSAHINYINFTQELPGTKKMVEKDNK